MKKPPVDEPERLPPGEYLDALGRKLAWDPDKEIFVGDDEANTWLSRPQRKVYEIEA